MERLDQSLRTARKALATLQELLTIAFPTLVERDASVQRFEYTFEAVWKAAKHYLREVEGLDLSSPKSVVRACREAGVLTEDQALLALEMTDDRNLTSHTYNEIVASKIFSRLGNYAALMDRWVEEMENGRQ